MLLINKGIICHHFFHVGIYSELAIFHINFIASRWYINPNIIENDLLHQIKPIQISGSTNKTDILPIQQVTFNHLLLNRSNKTYNNISKGLKVLYTQLFELLKDY